MNDLSQPGKLATFVRDAEQTASGTRMELARHSGVDMCFYEGIQWLNYASRNGLLSIDAFRTETNPDDGRFRTTMNEITRNIQRVQATTCPMVLDPTVIPPLRDPSPEAPLRAQAAEQFLSQILEDANFLNVRRDANFRRCVAGTWGVGLEFEQATGYICAYDFDPVRLILDPTVRTHQLHRHEYVIYKDVWTKTKILRTLGLDLPEDQLKTVGQLTPVEQSMARLSQMRLFSRYTSYSHQKGAIVYQVYVKNPKGMFDTRYVGVQVASSASEFVIPDGDPFNPFLGTMASRGLPMALYRGHARGDTMWGISDVSMMRDSQVMNNICWSFVARMLRKYAGWQWLVDRRSIGGRDGFSEENFRRQFHNLETGLIEYESPRDDNRNFAPPQIIQHPAPDPTILQLSSMLQNQIQRNAHRSDANFGQTKSHVPDASFQRAVDEGDQVLNIRVQEDLESDRALLDCALATGMARLARQDPAAARSAVQAGLDDTEIGLLMQTDPASPGWTIKIREGSVRHRSPSQRRAQLDNALAARAIEPEAYSKALARDLDEPLTGDDEYMFASAQRAAIDVLKGEDWIPLPLGRWSNVFIEEFRKVMVSKEARNDPAAQRRLADAAMNQQAMAVAGDPAMMQQTGQSLPGQAQAAGPDEADAASLLQSLRQTGV